MNIALRQSDAWSYLFAAACLACVAPLLVTGYPAMVDLPQHAAQIAGLRGTLDGTWRFASLFEVRAFTPYWLGYGLVIALSYVTGISLALKLVVGASVIAFPWSAARFLKSNGVPAAWFGWLLPLSLGFAFQWGFLSFIVAMPLAFLFLAHWTELSKRRDWRAYLIVVIWAHALFFAHLLIAAFALAVAALQVVTSSGTTRATIRRIAPLLSVVPIALVWLGLTMATNAQAHEPTVWKVGALRLVGLSSDWIAAPAGPSGSILGCVALAFPWLTGARWRRDPSAWLPMAFYVGFVLFFPLYVAGNAYTASRFAVFGLPLYFLCFESSIEPDVRRPAIPWAAVTAVVGFALIGWHTLRASIFDLEARDYRRAIAAAAPGARVLSVVIEPRGYGSATPYFLHLPAWYQAETGGLVEPSFAGSYAIPLQYRRSATPAVDLGFVWAPTQLDWARHQGVKYDYVVVRTRADPSDWLMQVSGCVLAPVSHAGTWWVFAKSERSPCDAGTAHRVPTTDAARGARAGTAVPARP